MKLILATVALLSISSTLAGSSHTYVGMSPFDGKDCSIAFDVVEKDLSIKNLRFSGALKEDRLIRKDVLLADDASILEEYIGDKVIKLKEDAYYAEMMKSSLNLRTKGFFGNQHKLELTGESLRNLRSIKIDSKVKRLDERVVKSQFECVSLVHTK